MMASNYFLHQFVLDSLDASISTIDYLNSRLSEPMIVGGDHREGKTILTVSEPLDAREAAKQLTRYCVTYLHRMIPIDEFDTLTDEAKRVLRLIQRGAYIRLKAGEYTLVDGSAVVSKTSLRVSKYLEARGLVHYDVDTDALKLTALGGKRILDS